MNTRHDVTAIIYDKRGRVLSVGKNNYVKTHTLQAHHARLVGEPYRQYLHAEIHAITRCPNLRRAHRIVVYRYHKNGQPAPAAPCAICRSAIAAAGIPVVEHT